jgi:hypothetical protein
MPVRWGGGSFAREKEMKKTKKNTKTPVTDKKILIY